MKSKSLKIYFPAIIFVIAVIASFVSLFKSIQYEQKIYTLTGQLHTLRIQNSTIDSQITQDFKRQNYDQIQKDWNTFSNNWNEFDAQVSINIPENPKIISDVDALEKSIQEKYERLLHYESDKAVLTNSLFFLIDLEKDISQNQNSSSKIANGLRQLINNFFYFNTNQTNLNTEITQLTVLIESIDNNSFKNRTLLLAHLRMLLEKNKSINNTINLIQKQQVAQKFLKLDAYLADTIEYERYRRMIFNSVIAILAMVMLAGFIVTFYRTLRDKHKIMELQADNEDKHNKLVEKMHLLNEYKRALDESSIVSKTDINGFITYVNEKFCTISGYTKEELLGQPHNIVRHPDSPSSLFKELWESIQNRQVFHCIIENKKKSGEAYFVDSTIIPILDENGEISEYIAIRNEISELIQAKNDAVAAGIAKGNFLANMSHELRTPLNAIIGFSQILMFKSDTPDPVKAYIEKINIAGKSLLSLVNTILDFSKIEAGKLSFKPEMVVVSNLMHDVGIIIEPLASKKSIQFNYPDLNSAALYLDQQLIQQVLLNLLSNAIKFTPEGGRVNISLEFDETNRVYCFGVCDSGIGIEAKDITTLFDPFTQIDNSFQKSAKGTGLGLAITKRIIEDLHGGKVWVESQMSQGSCFYFTIPISETQNTLERYVSPNMHAKRILIVEDAPDYQKILIDRLNKQYHLVVTNAVNKAKEILNIESFDFIVLDFFLVDGISSEILNFMEQNRIQTPVIIISAEDDSRLISSLPQTESIEGIFNKANIEEICDYLTKRVL